MLMHRQERAETRLRGCRAFTPCNHDLPKATRYHTYEFILLVYRPAPARLCAKYRDFVVPGYRCEALGGLQVLQQWVADLTFWGTRTGDSDGSC